MSQFDEYGQIIEGKDDTQDIARTSAAIPTVPFPKVVPPERVAPPRRSGASRRMIVGLMLLAVGYIVFAVVPDRMAGLSALSSASLGEVAQLPDVQPTGVASAAETIPTPIPAVANSAPMLASVERSGVVNTYRLNVRIGPGKAYSSFDVLKEGTRVTVFGRNEQSTWLNIAFGGERAWVSSAYITVDFSLEELPLVSP